MKTRGEIPRAIRACVAACTKSKANCAASASSRIHGAAWSAAVTPAAASTSTGPSEYDASPNRPSTRSSRIFPSASSTTLPSITPAATQNGTSSSGSRKSIGTKTSSVATARPGPTSNSTL